MVLSVYNLMLLLWFKKKCADCNQMIPPIVYINETQLLNDG